MLKYDELVRKLSKQPENEILARPHGQTTPMPSIENITKLIKHLKMILFPGFFGQSDVSIDRMSYYIGANLDIVYKLLSEEIKRGICFACTTIDNKDVCTIRCENDSSKIAEEFLYRLPYIKEMLATDVIAAYNGDPAARSYGEAIFCYPSISALTHHRIAHELLKLGVPLLPRIISEIAHSQTGIDIHPAASIGKYFFIDHGTGVVIGETSIIGNNVRLYQGVTLGAKSFPLDENGKPIKGIPRHPIVEDNVIIYSNSTLLGRITIGKNSIIGANTWIITDVPPNSKIIQTKTKEIKTNLF